MCAISSGEQLVQSHMIKAVVCQSLGSSKYQISIWGVL